MGDEKNVDHYTTVDGPFNVKNRFGCELTVKPAAILIFSLVTGTALPVFLNWQAQSGNGWLEDWVSSVPDYDELGHGIFEIRGTSNNTPDYPFRLAKPDPVGLGLAWASYLFHQIGQFYVLYLAKKNKNDESKTKAEDKYNNKLDIYNFMMIAINIIGVLTHFLVRKFYYDGLAGNTPEAISQASVVLLLVGVVALEQPRRGFLFGNYGKGIPCIRKAMYDSFIYFIRKYHGYIFSFGIVYAYHYQTYEATSAHFFGYFYTSFLLMQTNIIFHNFHKVRSWTVLLESGVLLHAVGVAVFQSLSTAMQFGFGFLFIVVFTVIPGVPAIQKIIYPDYPSNKFTPRVAGWIFASLAFYFSALGGFYAGGYFLDSPITIFIFIPLGYVISWVLGFGVWSLAYLIYHKCTKNVYFLTAYGVLAYVFVLLVTALVTGPPAISKILPPSSGELWANRTFVGPCSEC